MPADRSLSVRISSSPPAHRRCRSPGNQLRLGASLTPSLYAGLGENRPMDLIDLLLGRPLATEEEKAERIGPLKGIPIFGLDALSSAAYGPEAALTLLIPLGLAGVAYIVPISISIVVLLAIVYFSYRQTIMAYPQGGGSYTVASENLGVWPGFVGRSLADGGLRPDSSGGHFGWRGCPDFRHALAGEAYASSVPGNSYCGNAGESRGRQRSRRHFPCPNISVHLLPAGHDRAGRHQNVGVRRSSRPRDRTTPLDGDRRSPGHLAAAPGIRQRVHGHDRGGGRKQWCDGFQGTSFRHRTPHPYRGNRNSRGDAGRHRISLQGVWRGRHASRPSGLSECALAVACRHHRQGHLLRSEHGIDPGRFGLVG